MTKSFGTILEENKGFGSGFDFARIFLAVNVLAWHSPEIVIGETFLGSTARFWILFYVVLPMFFGLSGFLVAGSAQRLSLSNFALNRAMRIVPALLVEITLSAFVLGPLLTTFSLQSYFTNKHFYLYLLNIFGIIHYQLPGVFNNNPFPSTVNGSLWTVPFEIICYVVMAILIVTGITKRGALLLLAALLCIGASAVASILQAAFPDSQALNHLYDFYFHSGSGPALLPCFLFGAAAYALRYKLPHHWLMFLASVLIVAIVGVAADPTRWSYWLSCLIVCPPVVYIVCYVGLLPIPKIPFYSTGDYSYGVYLYGFPVQQSLIQLFPETLSWWPLHLVVSLLVVTVFATFSWHFIEKPILKMRKKFSLRKETRRDVSAEPIAAAIGLAKESR